MAESVAPVASSYPAHLVNSVNNADTTLRKSRLLSPTQYLPIYKLIYIFSFLRGGFLVASLAVHEESKIKNNENLKANTILLPKSNYKHVTNTRNVVTLSSDVCLHK